MARIRLKRLCIRLIVVFMSLLAIALLILTILPSQNCIPGDQPGYKDCRTHSQLYDLYLSLLRVWDFKVFTDLAALFFTAILVSFNISIAISTKRLWKEAFRQRILNNKMLRIANANTREAARAADAAKESADSLKASERGWIKDKGHSKHVGNTDTGQGTIGPRIMFEWCNIGRSPCILVKEANCFAFYDRNLTNMPDAPDYSRATENTLPRIIEPNDFIHGIAKMDCTMTPTEQEQLARGQIIAVIYGYMLYKDVFEINHETAYCWIWKNSNSGPGEWRRSDKKPQYIRQT